MRRGRKEIVSLTMQPKGGRLPHSHVTWTGTEATGRGLGTVNDGLAKVGEECNVLCDYKC